MDTKCGRYSVQKALVPVNQELQVRFFILKDNIPFNPANFFLDYKSMRSVNTGRQYAYCLCKFLNYLSEGGKTHRQATNFDVEKFIDYIIFGEPNGNVYFMKGTVTYRTVNEYIVAVTGFYQSLDALTEKETNIVLHKKTRYNGIKQKYLYGQIWQADYVAIVDEKIRLLKDSKDKIKWLKEDQITAIGDNFNSLRDKVIFMILVFCGTRIGETLSIMYQDYQNVSVK